MVYAPYNHGFVLPLCRLPSGTVITAKLSFQDDKADPFYDDKFDVLEFEAYDLGLLD